MKKGIYLGACRAYHGNYNLDYNDIVGGYHINLICDMLDVNLSLYDFIIASPPCNYYSRMNYRRNSSHYALQTKHLLPDILLKCALSGKPFIVENVRSPKLFKAVGIYDICNKYGIIQYIIGRHTYFTNTFCNLNCPQIQDFKNGGIRVNNDKYNQGGTNVHNVIEIWLSYINNGGNDND